MPNRRGRTFIALLTSLRANRDLSASLLPEHLHHYLDACLTDDGWYPAADWLRLFLALGQSIPRPHIRGEVWEYLGRTSAQGDLAYRYPEVVRPVAEALAAVRDRYAIALRSGDPIATLQEVVTTWNDDLDGDHTKLDVLSPAQARIEIASHGTASRELCRALTAYVAEAVQLAAGEQVSALHLRCRNRGDTRCVTYVQWTIDPDED